MDSNKRKSNSFNEDIVNFRVDEDIVNVQVSGQYIWCRCGEVSRSICGWVIGVLLLEDLVGIGKGNVDETLSIRNANGRYRQTRILVAPEKERDPEVELGLGDLGS